MKRVSGAPAWSGLHPIGRLRGWLGVAVAWLAGCGGGGSGPSVSGMTVQPVAYGRSAQWSVSGLALDEGIRFEISGGRCDGIVELPAGSPTQRLFTCTPRATGELVGRVSDLGGRRLATLKVDVPAPVVRLSLAQGAIDLELDPVAAPVTVDNFLGYVQTGYYDNTLIHRVVSGFVIQGGGYTPGTPLPVAKPPTQPAIANEAGRGLSNLRGTVAMARTADPDSATSQFFINVADNPSLDRRDAQNPGYAVFGRVVAGIEVVDAIQGVATRALPALGLADVPAADVVVTTARQLR